MHAMSRRQIVSMNLARCSRGGNRLLKSKICSIFLMILITASLIVNVVFIVFSLYSNNFQPAVYLKKMFFYNGMFAWSSLSTIVAICALGVSIFGFWWNYRANLKHNMFKEKLRVYREYVNNLGRSALVKEQTERDDIAIKHLQARQEILLFGSEKIALLTSEIEPVDLSTPEKEERYYELINEMRIDLLDSNSKLNIKIIGGLIGGKRWK